MSLIILVFTFLCVNIIFWSNFRIGRCGNCGTHLYNNGTQFRGHITLLEKRRSYKNPKSKNWLCFRCGFIVK